MIQPEAEVAHDGCYGLNASANPTRPGWNSATITTQCNVLESDFGWQLLPMGDGMQQTMLVSSMRYGLSTRADVRLGMTNHIWQSTDGGPSVQGVGDLNVDLRYRFLEQSRWHPALGFDYGVKAPEANPSKGLGTGFTDHHAMFIASHDLGHTHVDFNTVGVMEGDKHGYDKSVQFGLAVSRPISSKVSVMLESFGGPAMGEDGGYGAVSAGVTYAVHSWMVIDAGYSQAFTGGAPRKQFLFGLTHARVAGWPPLSRRFAPARLLGR